MMAFLECRGIHVEFRTHRRTTSELVGRADVPILRAVDGVDLRVDRGEAVGIVGESGCGKSTLARVVVGLIAPTNGTVWFDGARLGTRRSPSLLRRIQMVFQDPGGSLNPKMSVAQMLRELLRVHGLATRRDITRRCTELVERVELPLSVLRSRPRELSGGQRQRIAIARALAVEPDVLVADEAVSALDVSVQAAILRLLGDLRSELGLTLVFISHDLAVVRSLCDRVAVMYLGRIVEEATTREIFDDPRHPYTRALLNATPRLDQRRPSGHAALAGEPPSPLRIPHGCRFAPRCPMAHEICTAEDPTEVSSARRRVACHFAMDRGGSNENTETYVPVGSNRRA